MTHRKGLTHRSSAGRKGITELTDDNIRNFDVPVSKTGAASRQSKKEVGMARKSGRGWHGDPSRHRAVARKAVKGKDKGQTNE